MYIFISIYKITYLIIYIITKFYLRDEQHLGQYGVRHRPRRCRYRERAEKSPPHDEDPSPRRPPTPQRANNGPSR